MAKKKVRRIRKVRSKKKEKAKSTASQAKRDVVGDAVLTAVTEKTKSTNAKKHQTSAQKFELEYAYVLRDLRLVFILAGVMFVLLIVLNLVL